MDGRVKGVGGWGGGIKGKSFGVIVRLRGGGEG